MFSMGEDTVHYVHSLSGQRTIKKCTHHDTYYPLFALTMNVFTSVLLVLIFTLQLDCVIYFVL